jgi:lipopolysaccharide export system permease protein
MKRILRPVMALGLLAWVTTFSLSVWVAPRTAARLRYLMSEIQLKEVSLELKPRVFNESVANLILYVQDIAPNGLNWRGILLADMTRPNEPRVTFARSGALVQDDISRTFQLTLTDGNIVSPLAPSRYSDVSNFRTTTIPIPMPQAPQIPDKPIVSQTYSGVLWNRLLTGLATYEEQIEFHRRLALPFACVTFALVALALGVSTTRASKSIGLVVSLILMLVYYLVFIGGTRITANVGFSPLIGSWLANIVFAIVGVMLLIRSDREQENRILFRFAGAIDSVSRRLASVRLTRKQFGRWTYSLTHHPKFFRVLDIYILRVSGSFFL